jgi:hypothetical protein
MNKPPVLPKLFATVAEAAVILGLSRTAIYDKLIRRHPELLIQFDGRSLIDLEPAAVIVREMPRGPRNACHSCVEFGSMAAVRSSSRGFRRRLRHRNPRDPTARDDI